MRQGDGSELPGVSGPRSADIGVIYVAPNDDRQSVLAAIHTQDKLGRKQILIVLPEQNQAFRQPVDFDGLKSMRNSLKAQIVFVAPTGPGPAEFARQRRFDVYSSLDNFARALRDADQGNGNGKKGFSRLPWQKPASSPPDLPVAGANQGPMPIIPPSPTQQASVGSNIDDDDFPAQQWSFGTGVAVGGAAGLAAGAGIGTPSSQQGGPSPFIDDDDDFGPLPPAPSAGQIFDSSPTPDISAQTTAPSPSVSSTSTTSGAGPEPIVLPGGRTTAKLPIIPAIASVSSAQPNVPLVQSTPRRGNSGKMAVVGAAGGAMGAATSRTARAGGIPPTRGNVGGGGGGRSPRPGRGRLLVILAVLIVLTLLVVGGIAYTSGILGHLGGILPGVPPSATVTITPASSDLKKTYVIFGVTGNPDSSQRQVQARLLSSNTLPQSKTVPATGINKTPGVQATGTITFYNTAFQAQQVNIETFNLAGGLQIVTNKAVSIPASTGTPPNIQAGSASVSAHASIIGPAGNIGVSTINGPCCSTDGSIFAKNLNAFAGGQNPQNYTVVQQSDIDGAANPLVSVLTPEAQKSLNSQIHSNEHLVAPGVQCTPNVTPDHKAGDQATTVTVTVKVTCSAEVYDQQGPQTLAANLLRQEAAQKPGAGFALVGSLLTAVTEVTVTDTQKGTLSLLVKAEGVWVFQFSDAQKQALRKLIAGKSKKDAQNKLLKQNGVVKVDIQFNGDKLPTDLSQITIVVLNVPGLPGPGTPTAGSSPTTGAGTPAPNTPTAPTAVPSTGLGGI